MKLLNKHDLSSIGIFCILCLVFLSACDADTLEQMNLPVVPTEEVLSEPNPFTSTPDLVYEQPQPTEPEITPPEAHTPAAEPLATPIEVPEPAPEPPVTEPTPEPVPTYLEAPEPQGSVVAEEVWRVGPVGRPEPYVILTYNVWWEDNADGYDILIDGIYVETLTSTNTYTFQREHYGTLDQIGIAMLFVEVHVRGWGNDGQEMISESVIWMY